MAGFDAYLVARGDTPVATNPVPRGLSTRRQAGSVKSRTVPLGRVPRTLPKILSPVQVDALMGALRTWRDRAMVEAMVLAGLRRCEVLGLRLADIPVADRRVFVVDRADRCSPTRGSGPHPAVARVLPCPCPSRVVRSDEAWLQGPCLQTSTASAKLLIDRD